MARRSKDEVRFWGLIEEAWAHQPVEVLRARKQLARGVEEDDETLACSAVEDALDEVVEDLENSLRSLNQDELRQFDAMLTRKLYELDRHELQHRSHHSDEDFLFARGYVVALGNAYYEAVRTGAVTLPEGAECEAICRLAERVHEDRFGCKPPRDTSVSMRTGSNASGWSSPRSSDYPA
ncbi:MAG: DUF4240 domain-containing protein [Polyangiaceae bacterium]